MGRDPNENVRSAYVEEALRVWTKLAALHRLMTEGDMRGSKIISMNVKGPDLTKGGYLVVVKAVDEDNVQYVGFRSGETLAEVLSKVEADWANGTLHMKPDTPWKPPQGA